MFFKLEKKSFLSSKHNLLNVFQTRKKKTFLSSKHNLLNVVDELPLLRDEMRNLQEHVVHLSAAKQEYTFAL
jgi:hypothetical protein